MSTFLIVGHKIYIKKTLKKNNVSIKKYMKKPDRIREKLLDMHPTDFNNGTYDNYDTWFDNLDDLRKKNIPYILEINKTYYICYNHISFWENCEGCCKEQHNELENVFDSYFLNKGKEILDKKILEKFEISKKCKLRVDKTDIEYRERTYTIE
jgi:hypothetical protein